MQAHACSRGQWPLMVDAFVDPFHLSSFFFVSYCGVMFTRRKKVTGAGAVAPESE